MSTNLTYHTLDVSLNISALELEKLHGPIRREFEENQKRFEHMFNTKLFVLEQKLREHENNYRRSEHMYNEKLLALEQKLLELDDNKKNAPQKSSQVSYLENKLPIETIVCEKNRKSTNISDFVKNLDEIRKNSRNTRPIAPLICEEKPNVPLRTSSKLLIEVDTVPVKNSVREKEQDILINNLVIEGETSNDRSIKICDLTDPSNYSGLAMIPEKLTDGSQTFTQSICSEAGFDILMNNVQVVINYCEWLNDAKEKVATSFHIHICFTDKSVISGAYIDAYSANNVIKPLTIFKNIVNRYELSIDGYDLPKLPLSGERVRAKIKTPTNKFDKEFSICHDVDFEFYASIKKYKKTVQLFDGPYVVRFSDIQEAFDSRTDNYTSMLEEDYVNAQTGHDMATSFY